VHGSNTVILQTSNVTTQAHNISSHSAVRSTTNTGKRRRNTFPKRTHTVCSEMAAPHRIMTQAYPLDWNTAHGREPVFTRNWLSFSIIGFMCSRPYVSAFVGSIHRSSSPVLRWELMVYHPLHQRRHLLVSSQELVVICRGYTLWQRCYWQKGS
jgi:hypothetical protein